MFTKEDILQIVAAARKGSPYATQEPTPEETDFMTDLEFMEHRAEFIAQMLTHLARAEAVARSAARTQAINDLSERLPKS